MVKIHAIQSKGKQISLDIGTEILWIEPDLIYQYHLHTGMEIEDSLFKEMILENQELHYFRLCVSKLKKPMTVFELKTLMRREGATHEVVISVIDKLMKRKYVDDEAFAVQYIGIKKLQYGPEKIKEELTKKGVDNQIIQQLMSQFNEKMILNELIPSKIKSIKNKSKKAMMSSVKQYFLAKGFTSEIIESVIISHLSYYSGHEQELLQKSYEKILRQYQTKYEGYELHQIVMQKLYQKGFKMEDIRNIMHQHHDA